MHYRDIIEFYLPEKESYEFVKWAFGENFKELNPPELVCEWNKRHAKKLTVSPGGKPLEDIPKMIKLWRNENNNT